MLVLGLLVASLFAPPSPDASSVPPDTSVTIPDTASGDTIETLVDRLRWGDNLANVFYRHDLSPQEVNALLPVVDRHADLRSLKVGTRITMKRDAEGVVGLVMETPGTFELLHVTRTDPYTYLAAVEQLPVDTFMVKYEGTVTDNFYSSFLRAGGTPKLAVKFIEVFQFIYYFASETRRGDSYRILVEEIWQGGQRVDYGRILAAQYSSRGDTLTAVWQPVENSEFGGEYFDEQGFSFRRDLLRVPFPAARITSTFGIRRHPITGRVRMHHGVDLAAKMGTPVVAAGSGLVTRMGRGHPGYGNWVHIRHGRTGFETRYGHFRRIAPGIRRGVWVKQGDVIGYVGMTGHATGPHLHYEVFRDGRRLDPMRVKGSPVKKLEPSTREMFLTDRFYPSRLLLETPGMLPGDHFHGPRPEQLARVSLAELKNREG